MMPAGAVAQLTGRLRPRPKGPAASRAQRPRRRDEAGDDGKRTREQAIAQDGRRDDRRTLANARCSTAARDFQANYDADEGSRSRRWKSVAADRAKADAVGQGRPEAWNQSIAEDRSKARTCRAQGRHDADGSFSENAVAEGRSEAWTCRAQGANDADSSAEEHSADHRRAARRTARGPEAAAVESIAQGKSIAKEQSATAEGTAAGAESAGFALAHRAKTIGRPAGAATGSPSRPAARFPENAGAAAFASRAEEVQGKVTVPCPVPPLLGHAYLSYSDSERGADIIFDERCCEVNAPNERSLGRLGCYNNGRWFDAKSAQLIDKPIAIA